MESKEAHLGELCEFGEFAPLNKLLLSDVGFLKIKHCSRILSL